MFPNSLVSFEWFGFCSEILQSVLQSRSSGLLLSLNFSSSLSINLQPFSQILYSLLIFWRLAPCSQIASFLSIRVLLVRKLKFSSLFRTVFWSGFLLVLRVSSLFRAVCSLFSSSLVLFDRFASVFSKSLVSLERFAPCF